MESSTWGWMRGGVSNKSMQRSQHPDVRVKISRTFLSRKIHIFFSLEPIGVRECVTKSSFTNLLAIVLSYRFLVYLVATII